MALRQPLNGGLPRRAPSPYDPSSSRGWHKCSMVLLTVFASALLATLVTFGVLNFLLDDMTLPPLPDRLSSFGNMHGMQQQPADRQQQLLLQQEGGAADALTAGPPPPVASPPPLPPPPPPAKMVHPFSNLQHIYTLGPTDTSLRCQRSQICDGDHSCGPDGLGCVTAAKDRQDHVKKAIAWAWEGYRKYAWGHDEVDARSKSPHAWFNLGLTIVDSLDTLLLAGLTEEYQQARHWVANHLVFHDGHNVQFFEVNIRILGGLLSAYYLSDGDDLYLHKAQQLGDRLMVAFNTSSGIPTTFVNFKDADGRMNSGIGDSQTNQAEAGTISMEFTTIGRLLGRDDMFDAGMQFWYVLMSTKNYSGLYCMGIQTRNGECADAKMTIGSAADSMYEYMLKQWVLSNKTQEVPLQLYREAMTGVRKYLVRHIYDGTANMSFVSEAHANQYTGEISDTNDRFEHLTCFAGGMFILGKLHNISTNVTQADVEDIMLGARIGRACYELYHQAPSGVAPDSVHYERQSGGNLPLSSTERGPELGFPPRPPPAAPAVLPQQQPLLQQPPLQPRNVHRKKHQKKKRLNQLKQQKQAAAAQQGQQLQEQKPAATQPLTIQPKQGAADMTGHTGQQEIHVPHVQRAQQEQQHAVQQQQQQHIQQQQAQQQQAQQHAQQGRAAQLPADAPKPAALTTANQQQQQGGQQGQAAHQTGSEQPQVITGAGSTAGATTPAAKQQQQQLQGGAPAVAKEQPLNIMPGGNAAAGGGGAMAAGVQPRRHLMAEGLEQQRVAGSVNDRPEPDLVTHPAEGKAAEKEEDEHDEKAGSTEPGTALGAGAAGGSGDGTEEAAAAAARDDTAFDDAARSLLEDQPGADNAAADDTDDGAADDGADATADGDAAAAGATSDDAAAAAGGGADADAAATQQAAGQAAPQQDEQEQEEEEEEEPESPPPPPVSPPPPPPSPPPPPPPAGPIVVSWSQMSHADFLRPEAIETLFYLWRATGDEIYREWGWNMFRGFERWCRLDSGGYATVNDINQVPPSLANKMESFFVAETLKYFLLLFEDDPNVVPLDQWVLNTEAHPIPIWGSPADKRAMERTRQRRLAAKLERERREAEAAALREQAELNARKPARNTNPAEGYSLAGVQL